MRCAAAGGAPIGDDAFDHGQAGRAIDILGALLVHGERRRQHTGMGVGNAHQFQQALHACRLRPSGHAAH